MWRLALHSPPGQPHSEIPWLFPRVREGYVCTRSEKLRIYFSAQQKKTPNNPLSSGQAQSMTNPFVLVWCSWSLLPFAGRFGGYKILLGNGRTGILSSENVGTKLSCPLQKDELPVPAQKRAAVNPKIAFLSKWTPHPGKSCPNLCRFWKQNFELSSNLHHHIQVWILSECSQAMAWKHLKKDFD